MIKKSISDSSDGGRIEVIYSELTLHQVDRRIIAYEKKYGMPFSRFRKHFSCDDVIPGEVSDFMDWDSLVQEKAARLKQEKKQASYKS